MKRALLSLCFATMACWGETFALDAEEPVAASIRVEIQMVSLSTIDALKLVPALEDRKTASVAWTQVQTMLGGGHATLLGWPVLWLRSDGHGAAKSVEEHRFPTDFNPPSSPQIFGPPGGFPPAPAWGPRTPTAFETMDLGSSCDAQASVARDGRTITLTLTPRFVRLLGTREWHIQRSSIGAVGRMEMPEFQTSRLTAQLSVRTNEPVLLGVFVFRQPEPHTELFLLRARAALIPPGSTPPPIK